MVIKNLSNYVDFSIKNKEGKTPDELTNNILVHNIYCEQLLNKKRGKFPFQLNKSTEEKTFYQKYDQNWCNIDKLKDSTRKNKTLMHFLCHGDRLGAIQFLVEQGADVNMVNDAQINFEDMIIGGKVPLSFLFSKHCDLGYYLPSGFYYKNKFENNSMDKNNFLCHPKQFIEENFNKTEKWIHNETEKIVEYLIQQGADLSLDDHQNFPSLSDIMYKLLKKQNNSPSSKENENNKEIEKEEKNIEKEKEKSVEKEQEKNKVESNQEKESEINNTQNNANTDQTFTDKIIKMVEYIKKNIDTPEFHEKINKNSKKIIIVLTVLMIILMLMALLLTVLMMTLAVLATKVVTQKI
eukprot:jgi/Orpsp1_1/1182175/evm.model.c7180000080183.1